MTDVRWLLIAHSVPGFESEFENFSRFISATRPDDIVEVIGLPLLRQWRPSAVRGMVIDGHLPTTDQSYVLGAPIHGVREVALPTRSRADVLIGFDPISILHGRNCRASLTVLWAIDFVPTRGNRILDRVYRHLEGRAMRRVDLQLENNEAARAARQTACGVIPPESSIVPITIDTSIFADAPSAVGGLRMAFLGSLTERTGADRLLPIVERLRSQGVDASLDIIGRGPLLDELRRQVTTRGLVDVVELHGFVDGDHEVAEILARCNVGLAPFAGAEGDFTWFADPQKIKFYLAAGLHVVTADVPPIASSVAAHGAGSLLKVEATTDDWVQHLADISRDPDQLTLTQLRAQKFAREFERSTTYQRLLEEMLQLLK